MEKLLFDVKISELVKGETKVLHFKFFGNVLIEAKHTSTPNDAPFYVTFENVRIELYDNEEKASPYKVTAVSFAGRQLDEIDAAMDVLNRLTRNDESVLPCYTAPEIRIVTAFYAKDENVACSLDGHEIRESFFDASYGRSFTLDFATTQYSYYSCYDRYIMLSSEDGMLISDNNFAEDGYADSIIAVEKGEEILLYGEYDKEYAKALLE